MSQASETWARRGRSWFMVRRRASAFHAYVRGATQRSARTTKPSAWAGTGNSSPWNVGRQRPGWPGAVPSRPGGHVDDAVHGHRCRRSRYPRSGSAWSGFGHGTGDHTGGSIPGLHAGCGHADGQQPTQGVDHPPTLAAFDFLASVIALFPALGEPCVNWASGRHHAPACARRAPARAHRTGTPWGVVALTRQPTMYRKNHINHERHMPPASARSKRR